MTITRRRLLELAIVGSGLLAGAGPGRSAVPRLVVVGGGPGGAVAARTASRLGGDRVHVTLVEANPTYVSCFFSNWVVAGLRTMADITHRPAQAGEHGIDVVTARVEAIDREGKALRLSDGSRVPYDRLILSPGVDFRFDTVAGYSVEAAERMPHAWKAGPQTELLIRRLAALDQGASVVMVVPPNPYRCPPGPYERAALMAHVLKTSGRGDARITILDAKESFPKQALFQEGWERHYPGMIQWLPPSVHGGLRAVEPAGTAVETEFDRFDGDLVSVIPPQKAGALALDAGLGDADGWCPVEAASMRAKADPSIQVIGDAARAGEMPKSAFAAASQGRVAAVAALADLLGGPRPEPRYFNTCWSLIAPGDAVKVGALYGIAEGAIKSVQGFVSQPGESAEVRRVSAEEAEAWHAAILADMIG
ncbi:NAD(P)/FAD-dependent oxidoreductase [Chthonobacter rhizosphaerae]|uniref:NAD(P)/FAD-dependent oxidoreductase n=1 Tax=Chthonobacter rhizosphaerae TaxID=2735553 RepID=UPI0015EE7476|nr:FAD/NAD(P)-binding oxidoreductase [Chthonobacter rhizosphaerae]